MLFLTRVGCVNVAWVGSHFYVAAKTGREGRERGTNVPVHGEMVRSASSS